MKGLLFLFLFCGSLSLCAEETLPVFSYATFQYRGGSGRSYKEGYESAKIFISPRMVNEEHQYPFLDFRIHRVEEGKGAFNAGLGWRTFFCDFAEMFGINIFYDYRHLSQGKLQDIGLGVELLHRCWDLRMNGYIPVGKKVQTGVTIFDYGNGFVARRNEYRKAMWGLDVEVGRSLGSLSTCCGCLSFYGGIGPYFYGSHCCNSLMGGMARFSIALNCYMDLNFYATYDRIFKTKGQAEIRLYIPLSSCFKEMRCYYFPVQRNEIIITERICGWKANFG